MGLWPYNIESAVDERGSNRVKGRVRGGKTTQIARVRDLEVLLAHSLLGIPFARTNLLEDILQYVQGQTKKL